MSYPFFRAVKADGAAGFTTSGVTSCRLGHRFETPGDSPREQGQFAEWNWDGARLTARVDRLGFYSLFYVETEREVMVSSSPVELIAQGAPSELDDHALAVFFRIGLFLNEYTAFKQIRVLPPGGTLTWDGSGRARITGGVRIEPQHPMTREEASERFIALFRQAVRRCLEQCDGDVVLPLSGGRDSRHILFELKKANALPRECITYNYHKSVPHAERLCAEQVAQAVGAKHTVLRGTSAQVSDQLRTLVAMHLCTDEGGQFAALRDFVRRDDCIIFDGIAGDVLSRNRSFNDVTSYDMARRGEWDELARRFIDGHAKISRFTIDDVIGSAEAQRRFSVRAAQEYLSRTMRKFEGAPDAKNSFTFWNRTRREISLMPTALHADARRVMCPYLDYDLQTFLASMPQAVTSHGTFHDDAIAAAFPEYASIPYHDQIEAPPARSGALWQVKRAMNEVRTIAKLNWRRAAGEIPYATRSIKSEVARRANVYRLYLMCLESCRDAAGARHLLNVVAAMDPPLRPRQRD